MTSSSVARFSKLQLVLEPGHRELVRAFVREAALTETVPVPVASLIADDAVEAWQALCLPESARQRASVELLCSRGDVRARILLQGHSRFSHVVASLAGRVRRDAGVSCHEHGIDGWEVSVHRSLSAAAELPAASYSEEPVAAPAAAAPTPAHDYVIDLPKQSDAAAIARCFLEVYGRHYVHAEVPAVTGTRSRPGNSFRPWRGTARAKSSATLRSSGNLECKWPNAARPSSVRRTAAMGCWSV